MIVKFSAPISHQGEMLLVVIPKRLHSKVKKYADSRDDFKITIEEL